MTAIFSPALEHFRRDYAAHRAAEGRGLDQADLFSLPYLRTGPFASQWAVRARTFDALMNKVVRPMARSTSRPLEIADLGAGNGWLSYRLSLEGHACHAIDVRDDMVDGLGAASPLRERAPFYCHVASFDAVPLAAASVDLAIFNASLHYSTDLGKTLAEARRIVRSGGAIAIVDSPCYAREADGEAMVAAKRAAAGAIFGDRAETLMGLPFAEYLTVGRLAAATRPLAMTFARHPVRYPLGYELRPIVARLRGRRTPSRFDLWTARVP